MGIVIAIVLAVLAAALMLVAKKNSTFVATLANVATIIATLAAIVMLVVSFPSSSSLSDDPPPTPNQVSNIPPTQAPIPASATPPPAMPTTPSPPTKMPVPTVTPSPTSAFRIGSTKTAADGSLIVFVPAGEFLMGSIDYDKNADADEKPQHTVYLDAYWIGKYDVTNTLYKKCVDAGRCRVPTYWTNGAFPAGKENHPVVGVRWDDAVAYAKWVGGRLPTEAEWEKAACWDEVKKAKRIYPWGNGFDAGKANTAESGIRDTTSVDRYPNGASPYGALDMAGNVWEWTSSLAMSYPYRADDGREDSGAFGSRSLRGGSWFNNLVYARCASRLRNYPPNRDFDIGFRVAESVP